MRNEDLERAIAEAPDDLDALTVYSDWLSEHGEPHGALIALHLRRHAAAVRAPPSIVDLVEEARLTAVVFDALKQLRLPSFGYVARLGFLHELRLGGGGKRAGPVLRTILAHRTAPFLRSLEIEVAPSHGRRWSNQPSKEDRDEKATAASVWEALRELGLPRTVRIATLPVPPGREVADDMRVLARVEELTWPFRSVAILEEHRHALPALRALTLSSLRIDAVNGSRLPVLLEALSRIPELASLPEVTVASPHSALRSDELATLAAQYPNVRVVYV